MKGACYGDTGTFFSVKILRSDKTAQLMDHFKLRKHLCRVVSTKLLARFVGYGSVSLGCTFVLSQN